MWKNMRAAIPVLLVLLVTIMSDVFQGMQTEELRKQVATLRKNQAGVVFMPSGGSGWYSSGSSQQDVSTSVPLQKWKDSLPKAVEAWSKALGVPVKTPTLVVGQSRMDCGSAAAVACADRLRYRITVVGDCESDEHTVLMHEIGHLLGVPHITDDPLMGPTDTMAKKLSTPSGQAVALAKLHLHGSEAVNERKH